MDACRYRLVRAGSAQQFVTFRYDWLARQGLPSGSPVARRYTLSQKYSPDAIPLNISSPDSMMFCRQ